MSKSRVLLVWCLVVSCAVAPFAISQSLVDQMDERLRDRIESGEVQEALTVCGDRIYSEIALPVFYERRGYRPAWIAENGPSPQADSLLRMISKADREGLRPQDYHLHQIESMLNEMKLYRQEDGPRRIETLTDLDLLLTDAFLIYGSHLLMGRINPVTIDPEWHANRREADLALVLQRVIESDGISESLKRLLPPQPGYMRLRKTLADYRALTRSGGWPVIPAGGTMQKGDTDDRIAALRTRLMVTGDERDGLDQDTGTFDETLDEAVRLFQKRHGLDVDGIVGRRTLEAMNVPVEERLNQIILNMERWRWLPQDLGERYIIINIANFELDVVEAGAVVLTMRVVVGRDYRRTPVFSDRMTYLVFNPYWNVPESIAIQDKIPLIQKDPEYLRNQNMKVFQGWGSGMKEVDPQTINWSKVSIQNFPYHFRQEPGPNNALGRIKFMFPNTFDVYLHDTPARELFAQTERTFSSGCIRIEKPVELAEYVLKGNPGWKRENILEAVDKKIERTVPLPQPIPVHLLYWTAWVDETGIVNFRKDIYGRDAILSTALSPISP